MKIIKHGNEYSQKKFECEICGCVYIAENSEYHFEPWQQHEESEDLYVCKCPECGARNCVNAVSGAKNCVNAVSDLDVLKLLAVLMS